MSKSNQVSRDLDVKRQRDATVRAALLRWYRKRARALPWRSTKDPYAIWVSEIMLQQTQVATVIPYYKRFLRVFPTCRDLAAAPFTRVAQLWSGLGYYRRARFLHVGAQKVVKDFGAVFPGSYDEARDIPGVGHYTASAVLSIAYGLPLPVLDGNVGRVLARLDALRGNLAQSKFRRSAERRLSRLISSRKPGDFNQALMELGQTLCLPRLPLCYTCPLQKWCRAHSSGDAQDFPAPRPRRATESRQMAAAVIREDHQVALVRGLDEGLLEDLLNFPCAFGESQEEAREKLGAKLECLLGSRILWGGLIGTVRHRITFRSIQVAVYAGQLRRPLSSDLLHWLPVSRVKNAAVSQLARKVGSLLQS